MVKLLWLTASLAGAIVVLEGAQQMFQFHPNWISYRGTAETLRQQAFRYVAEVSPFDDPTTRRERLAASLRDTTMKESATWTDTMRTGSRSDVDGRRQDRLRHISSPD